MYDLRISRHSVLLDADACKGCTNCLKRCPVEAIRVRKGKASILEGRCVDCGECIRSCPYKAKKADTDSLSVLDDYDFRIALVAPALYAQLDGLSPVELRAALASLGFQDAFEVSEAAELVTAETRRRLSLPHRPKPLLSSSCPAVLRLILVRYPGLVPHLSPLLSPMELSARMAKERARALGIQGRIGAFFLTPCPAKVTAARLPLGHNSSSVDGAIAIRDIYLPLVGAAGGLRRSASAPAASTDRSLLNPSGSAGLAWARPEGESEGLSPTEVGGGGHRAVAVDGMDRVLALLEEVENGRLEHVDFVELLACPGGCLGGPLTVENPTLAKTKLREAERQREGAALRHESGPAPEGMEWTEPPQPQSTLLLHDEFSVAAKMLEDLERIAAELPGLDCGSCGSPTCRSLAEDIVRGVATRNDCIFILRERLRGLTKELMDLESLEPPSLDRDRRAQEGEDGPPGD